MSSNFRSAAAAVSEQERERLVFRYTQRYGQRPETEKRYGDAIHACGSIENLSLTVAEIARMYDVNVECLRNQLKRHFPEIIPGRDAMREKLGYTKPGNYRGLKDATVKKYADAVELLRDSSLTVREAAERCGVSYQGLQQHLLFYHKDIADSRMLARADALLLASTEGTVTGSGGVHEPRSGTKALYAAAVELYRTTRLTIPEIAGQCGLAPHNLGSYLRKWHGEEVKARRLEREKELLIKKKAERTRPSKAEIASRKYAPAIALIEGGDTLSESAAKLNVDVAGLRSWMKHNHPDVLERCKLGMMRLTSGKYVSRKKWEKYEPVAEYICTHPSKSSAYVAEKFSVPLSSMQKHVSVHYPDVWERHCRACASKAAKEREKKKAASAAAKGPSASELTAAKYAEALKVFASGEKSVAQVAEEFGHSVSAFGTYLRKHYPDLIENRRRKYALQEAEARRLREIVEQLENDEWELRKAQRRHLPIPKYEPAVAEYRKGQTGLKPLAAKFGLCDASLRNYICSRYPELIEARKMTVREELDRKYASAAQEIVFSKDSIDTIARRHGLSRNGFRNYIERYGPHLMDIHKAVTRK